MQWKVRKKSLWCHGKCIARTMKNAATIYPAEGGRSQLLALIYLLWEKKSCSYSNWILIVQSAITQLTSENSPKEDLTQYKRVDVQEYKFASVNTEAHNKLHISDQIHLKRLAIISPVYCTTIHVFYRHGHSS